MKKKKVNSKLTLKKQVISNLKEVKGGKPWTFGCTIGCEISVEIDCPGTYQGDCI